MDPIVITAARVAQSEAGTVEHREWLKGQKVMLCGHKTENLVPTVEDTEECEECTKVE